MNTPEDELHQVSAKAVTAFLGAFKMDALPISVGQINQGIICVVLYWVVGVSMNSSFVFLPSTADSSIIEPWCQN